MGDLLCILGTANEPQFKYLDVVLAVDIIVGMIESNLLPNKSEISAKLNENCDWGARILELFDQDIELFTKVYELVRKGRPGQV